MSGLVPNALVLLLAGCAPEPTSPSPAAPTTTPEPEPEPEPIREASVVLAPTDPLVPLVRTLAVTCTVPCEVGATWADEARARAASSALALEHELPLVGMRPGTAYTAELTITDAVGQLIEVEPVGWQTDPLPAVFPTIVVHTTDPGRMEPGNTLVGTSSRTGDDLQVVLDHTGAVVWYRQELQGSPRVWYARVQPDGRLLGLTPYDQVHETDWTGRTLRRWWAGQPQGEGVGVDVPAFHHEVRRTTTGDVLTLTHEAIPVTGFPVSYWDPAVVADVDVMVDRVVQLQDDGTVLHDHDLSAVLDVRRIGYMSLELAEDDTSYDWSHANSATEHVEDDGLVVSVRHQDAVIEIDRQTGALRWILANPDNWTPELDALRLVPIGDPFEWPYHQHAVEIDAEGRLLMFDNGNGRASPFVAEGPPLSEMWSRVVEYRVDEDARTVEQLWEFQVPGERLWSGAMGNAERQPTTGNVLSLWGSIYYVDGVPYSDGGTTVRLVEFVPETGEVVLDVAFDYDPAVSPGGWNAYRAHRVPAL